MSKATASISPFTSPVLPGPSVLGRAVLATLSWHRSELRRCHDEAAQDRTVTALLGRLDCLSRAIVGRDKPNLADLAICACVAVEVGHLESPAIAELVRSVLRGGGVAEADCSLT